jgi:predicted TIM-barrel fold metal-dependent hydrolase
VAIDCQTHWYPAAFFEALLGRTEYPRTRREGGQYVYEFGPGASLKIERPYWDFEVQLATFAEAGIDRVVSSPAGFALAALPPAEETALARLLNREFADAQRAHPNRFHGLATLPLHDAGTALEVLDEAVADGLRGVHLPSNVGGESLDSPRLRPVWARLATHAMPVFLHPTRTIFAHELQRFGLEYVVGFVFDTTVAVLALVFSGVLDEFPELEIVHPHLGGTIPYLAGRIDHESSQPWAARALERPPSEYLRRFFVDTVSSNPGALELALGFYGTDHVLLGTDFPWWPTADGVALVRKTLAERSELDAVLDLNARRLLRL